MDQTDNQAAALFRLPELVGQGEVLTDRTGSWFSADTGSDREAVQVEYSGVYDNTPYFAVVRRWDRTGGLASEITVGSYSTDWEAASGVQGALLACRDRDARMERAMAQAEAERIEPQDQWFIDWAEHDAHRGDGDDHDV